MTESTSDWKKLHLSLERPYKDDDGKDIPVLEDIDFDGNFIFEQKESLDDRLKTNLLRIFSERGHDFFHDPDKRFIEKIDALKEEQAEKDKAKSSTEQDDDGPSKHMTFEELHLMREELIPNLQVAIGEMTQARDILNALLTTVQPQQSAMQSLLTGGANPVSQAPSDPAESGPKLTATVVTKQPPLISAKAFDAQLVIGMKDEALRKAVSIFDAAATRLENSQKRGEKYWVNALKIRKGNWRLIPSPLPPGSFVGKGADRTSKDFLVSYGLEESPMIFRRRAIANLSDVNMDELAYASRPRTVMQLSLRIKNPNGDDSVTINTMRPTATDPSVEEDLARAQTEIIDQEIFTHLSQEASTMPTVLTRVSERTIIIDAAEDIELRFDLIKQENMDALPASPICDVIYHCLHVLLLRKHGYQKIERLSATAAFGTIPLSKHSPPILQPIIDFLQYNLFCEKLEAELNKAADGLKMTGISASVVFNGVGETGEELVKFLSEPRSLPISGEAILTISERHTIRFTFVAPSNLTAHLSQATIHVYSMVQLSQLLTNEIERFLLQHISQLGQRLRGGTWLIDLDHLVARWEGCVLTFQLAFDKDLGINFTAFRLDNKTGKRGDLHHYARSNAANVPLLSWVEEIISKIP